METQDHAEIAEQLPEKRVYLDDRCYCIHGLIHGNAAVSINPSIKKEINRQLSGYNVICEDGFSQWIKGSESFREVEYFGLNRLSFKGALFALRYIFSSLSPGKELEIIEEVRQMNSIKEMNLIRDKLFQGYLPEPQGMNFFMFQKNKGTLDNPYGELPLRIKRYVYEAKKSVKYSAENNLRELHIVTGCAHELPLEYLLKNPDVLSRLSVRLC